MLACVVVLSYSRRSSRPAAVIVDLTESDDDEDGDDGMT